MGRAADKRRRMNRTPDERREILRAFMAEHGLKAARWAKESAVSANSIYNFLNGSSDALDPRTYAKLARTAGVPSWKISGDVPEAPSPTMVWVSGDVQAGAWRDAVAWDRSRWYPVDVPIAPRFHRFAKALEVRGTSMNREYAEGSVLIWVDMLDARPPRHLDHVIVYAYRTDDTVEATVKELRIVDGKRWLWPKSDDPAHQAPVNVDDPGEHIARIEIQGLVIGDYRQRIV
jgi:phage repressor protein C with HTH and peptisase S24 domain